VTESGVTEPRTTSLAAILAEEWVPDSDELTPTMKLKRRPIAQKYAPQIEGLYTTRETK
jgi:long-subunit acyl-CoA synthetase (AMP-forming)